eukprot:TRINITY_DN2258_c0_g1_i1.p1 TRINITY_DN2258_c0_g1~~TRINITY_DN2258_c0_g1_i1.p1  ORF type:complete len:339 (-),score=54.46 TRINITY_DN2258_c0_g1_i1:433-1449(-)
MYQEDTEAHFVPPTLKDSFQIFASFPLEKKWDEECYLMLLQTAQNAIQLQRDSFIHPLMKEYTEQDLHFDIHTGKPAIYFVVRGQRPPSSWCWDNKGSKPKKKNAPSSLRTYYHTHKSDQTFKRQSFVSPDETGSNYLIKLVHVFRDGTKLKDEESFDDHRRKIPDNLSEIERLNNDVNEVSDRVIDHDERLDSHSDQLQAITTELQYLKLQVGELNTSPKSPRSSSSPTSSSTDGFWPQLSPISIENFDMEPPFAAASVISSSAGSHKSLEQEIEEAMVSRVDMLSGDIQKAIRRARNGTNRPLRRSDMTVALGKLQKEGKVRSTSKDKYNWYKWVG